MRNIASLLLLCAFVLVGIAADNVRENDDEDIHEAVFRWQFDHNTSGQQKKAKVYFLEAGKKGGDPSDALLRRFAANQPPVRKRSECDPDAGPGVVDKRTGERGLLFRVSSIRWKSDVEVEARGGFYESGLSASRNLYTLKKEEGKWKVTKDAALWVS
jgi:hypothetical protein